MSAWHIAGLVFIVPAAWYVQWVTRWAGGPFGALEWLRDRVLGVAVGDDRNGGFHHPTRGRLSAIGLIECAGCTLFWVAWPLLVLWWFAPLAIVGLGVAGAAFLADEWRGGL